MSTFAKVPDALALDTSMSDKAIRLYAVLRAHAGNDSRECSLSNAVLRERAAMSHGSMHAARQQLIDAGWLTVERRDGGRNARPLYVCHDEPVSQPTRSGDKRVSQPTANVSASRQRRELDVDELDVEGARCARAARAPARDADTRRERRVDNACLPEMPERLPDECVIAVCEASATPVTRRERTQLHTAFERLAKQYDAETLLVTARELGAHGTSLTQRAAASFAGAVARRRAIAQRSQSNAWSALAADTFEQMREQGWDPFASSASGEDTR